MKKHIGAALASRQEICPSPEMMLHAFMMCGYDEKRTLSMLIPDDLMKVAHAAGLNVYSHEDPSMIPTLYNGGGEATQNFEGLDLAKDESGFLVVLLIYNVRALYFLCVRTLAEQEYYKKDP